MRIRRTTLTLTAATLAAITVAGCTSGGAGGAPGSGSVTVPPPTAPRPTSGSPSTAPSIAPSSPTAVAGKAVHIKLLEDDTYGPQTYGVGMPIVAYFSTRITSAKAFSAATAVTVNGKPDAGAWWFEKSALIDGYPVEGHYRPASGVYWPANAAISMTMKTRGVSAGTGLAFDNSLTLQMKTGAKHVSMVDCGSEQMTVTADDKTVDKFPVSCGKAQTPTYTGVKIVMQKGENLTSGALRPQGAVEMRGTSADPYDLIVPWSVRVTQSGEYVHAASWNGGNIGRRSTSNGCTNLNVAAAKTFYSFSLVGDVVQYVNTGGQTMPAWDGFGDWNVPQEVWRTGGLVSTTV